MPAMGVFNFNELASGADQSIPPYRAAGFTPILTVAEPASKQDTQLSEALFRHLGPDRDGRLTLDHFKRAPMLLRKLDEKEDEVLTPRERKGRSRHDWEVNALAFSPDGKALAVGLTEFTRTRALWSRGVVKIWDVTPWIGEPSRGPEEPHR